jgi:hypothetical protein
LDLDDLPETKNWYELKKENLLDSIPWVKFFRVISSFINSAWNENRSFLRDFLGFNANLYWSSTEFHWDKAFKIGFSQYVQDIIDSKTNSLSIRTMRKY